MRRRDFIKQTGLALAGATTASALLTTTRRAIAANPTEITFASAKFFGKQTIAEVVEAYNASQNKVRVVYKELPPPSSSTEVHQALVQQLARRNGNPDAFTLDIIWIAEFADAKWALPLDEYFKADTLKRLFPRHGTSVHLAGQASRTSLVHRLGHVLLSEGSVRGHWRESSGDLAGDG